MSTPRPPRKLLRATVKVAALVVLGAAETACNLQVVPRADTGPRDSGANDSATQDAGATDAGPVDTGPVDAGPDAP